MKTTSITLDKKWKEHVNVCWSTYFVHIVQGKLVRLGPDSCEEKDETNLTSSQPPLYTTSSNSNTST